MVNKCIFIGNLGKDPEVRTMGNGGKVCNISLGVSESWTDKNSGEKKSKTEWVKIVIFNENLVRVAENYLKKGSKVYIEGALQTRKWTDQSGVDKYSTEIVLQNYTGVLTMLDSRGDNNNQGGGFDDSYQRPPDQGQRGADGALRSPDHVQRADDLDDDIPF